MMNAAPRILVVDDDPDVRSLAVSILHDAGYVALPAENGDIALSMLENGLTVDLLFTDIVMPGELDGFALAVEARRVQPDLKILYTSGFNSILAERAGKMIDAKILAKPYRPALLAGEVMRLLSADAPVARLARA